MREADYNPDRGAPEREAGAGLGCQFTRGVLDAAEAADLETEPGPRTDQPDGAAPHVVGRDILVNVREVDGIVCRRVHQADAGDGVRAQRFSRDAERHGEDGASAEGVDAAAG